MSLCLLIGSQKIRKQEDNYEVKLDTRLPNSFLSSRETITAQTSVNLPDDTRTNIKMWRRKSRTRDHYIAATSRGSM